MKHFRRSTKSTDKVAHHISIPQKDAIAIVPPKKVIKALYDYQVQDPINNPDYLSFSSGDFLHVVDRENDPDWYEACNPIVGTRGLVPVNYFELISKQANVRNSGGPDPTIKRNQYDANGSAGNHQSMQGHDSGYAEKAGNGGGGYDGQSGSAGIRMSKIGRNSGAMVYGIVQYDFKAERPDELEARAGEAIIVIAQSNPEWFLAKPITRLGGPGLIPVSFIEIRDMTSGKAVPDTQDAVARAGVPKVEEWKRMAASYKNSSIPLGRLDSSHGQQESARGSMSGAHRPSQDFYGQQDQPFQPMSSSNPRFSQFPTPLRARVPRYAHHEGKYWFVIEAFMDDGKHWELNREYPDFYALQTQLMDDFPEAAGRDGHKRTLPFMPGPLPWVTERLTSERREHMDRYLLALLKMSPYIVSSQAVRSFFNPRDGDQEIEGSSDADASVSSESEWVRLSQGSSQQSVPFDSRQSSTGNLSSAGTGYTSPSKGPQPPQAHSEQPNDYPGARQPQGHYRNTSDLRNAPGFNGNGNGAGPPPGPNTGPMKIKVFFGDTNCVVIRMPPQFSYMDLVHKLRDRYSLEPDVDPSLAQNSDFHVEYRDESSNGGYYPMYNDNDLRMARERNEKLTLRVGPDTSF